VYRDVKRMTNDEARMTKEIRMTKAMSNQ